MARRVRSRRQTPACVALEIRFHQNVQTGNGRREISLVRIDGGLSPVVRRKPTKLAGLWPRLNTSRPRRFATRLRVMVCVIYSSESLEPSCLDIQTQRRTPTFTSKNLHKMELRSSAHCAI